MRILPIFISIVIFFMGAVSPLAATITSHATGSPVTLVFVDGEIAQGDHQKFLAAIQGVELGAILLRSEGGDLLEGLEIGRTIRSRGFSTGVAPDFACASACGLIWLAGVERFMAPSALVGFHAAYVSTESGPRESGVGNALVGAYVTELGLPVEAVIFSTIAGPNEINWLTIEAAQRAGIDVEVLDIAVNEPMGPSHSQQPPLPLQLPSGFRWIVLASDVDPSALMLQRYTDLFGPGALTVAATTSGHYALALGPLMEVDAEAVMFDLMASGAIPVDAYLSSGNGFTVRFR